MKQTLAITGNTEVWVILRKEIKEVAEQVESVTPTIMVLTFTGNPASTFSCYFPTSISPEEKVAEFNSNRSDVISQIPANNVVFVCGDSNAKVGLANARKSFHKETSRNEEYLINLLETFDLVAANTTFEKPSRKHWTFKYPNGSKAQLVRKIWARNSGDSQQHVLPSIQTINAQQPL